MQISAEGTIGIALGLAGLAGAGAIMASGYSSDCQNQKYEAISEGFVADEAVSSEPVCGSNSLLTGKITGNFTKIGPFGEKLSARTQQNQLFAGQFPTK